MQDFKVSIPRPCAENWTTMSPEKGGRFCGSCKKTVVDFTAMSTDQILDYFLVKRGEKLCGRFHISQTTVPIPYLHQKLISWQAHFNSRVQIPLFRACLLMAIGACMTLVGCQNTVKGEKMPSGCNDVRFVQGDSTSVVSKDTLNQASGEQSNHPKKN
jgi:hypothetical protein